MSQHRTDAGIGIREIGVFELTAYDADNNVIWTDNAYNALADEGEHAILDVFLRGATAPTQFYLRLYNDTIVETDTLAALTGEPTANGYETTSSRLIERSAVGWPTLALDTGDFMATSKTITIVASGNIGPVTYVALATTSDNIGKLISYAALSTGRTLVAGDSLQITYKVKLQ